MSTDLRRWASAGLNHLEPFRHRKGAETRWEAVGRCYLHGVWWVSESRDGLDSSWDRRKSLDGIVGTETVVIEMPSAGYDSFDYHDFDSGFHFGFEFGFGSGFGSRFGSATAWSYQWGYRHPMMRSGSCSTTRRWSPGGRDWRESSTEPTSCVQLRGPRIQKYGLMRSGKVQSLELGRSLKLSRRLGFAGGAVSYTHLDVYKRQIVHCPDGVSIHQIGSASGIHDFFFKSVRNRRPC